MKIRTKLILANLLIVLFLLGSLTYVLIKKSSDIVLDNVMENAQLSLSQVSANLDNKLHSYENIANTMYLNTSLQIMLQTQYKDMEAAYVDYFASFQPYDLAMRTTQNIAHMKIYTDNPSFVFANFSLIDNDILNSNWYKKAMESQFGNYWTASYDSTFPTERLFSFRQRLNNFNVNSPLVVSLEIDISVLDSLVTEESKRKRIIFAHADGAVFIDSSKNQKIANIVELPFYDELQASATGNIAYKEGKQSYRILFQTLSSRNAVKG
ncbi:hypothetical protein EHS13_11955 [Paenibacillus psychroresistens]|uniref:Uncharacterized protein n=1 Tax=Paenibacillus psychroresistens TaxID=1778678 RepID=A0A6B8RIY4_9BACL|nr:cache domain-containing protein [Paenibacillus psychroresistens]QGQ95542.1 hypothetical protein EHS13_11955 [Paenibacillus psychroresistens]